MEKQFLTRDKIIGKQVIDSEAMIVGSVKDLSIDFEAKEIAILITSKTGAEVTVLMGDISNAGDVILLNKTVELPPPPEAPPEAPPPPPPEAVPEAPPPEKQPGLCLQCGYLNALGAKFCIKCGNKL
ncbi:MAG: PRC-barrel domain-containing protein [Candidatus Bathyarchaeia archaeon]